MKKEIPAPVDLPKISLEESLEMDKKQLKELKKSISNKKILLKEKNKQTKPSFSDTKLGLRLNHILTTLKKPFTSRSKTPQPTSEDNPLEELKKIFSIQMEIEKLIDQEGLKQEKEKELTEALSLCKTSIKNLETFGHNKEFNTLWNGLIAKTIPTVVEEETKDDRHSICPSSTHNVWSDCYLQEATKKD